jgi:hypothetical protein
MPADQWWAVVDGDGELVSSGTVVARPLPAGLEAIKVDAPARGQVWDPTGLRWVTPPAPPEPLNPAAVLVALARIAKDGGKTLEQKLALIVGALAESAPD